MIKDLDFLNKSELELTRGKGFTATGERFTGISLVAATVEVPGLSTDL